MVFGCYCCDEDDDENKEQLTEQGELRWLVRVKDMWLRLPLDDKRELQDVDHIFWRSPDNLSNALEPHIWYIRCMMFMLCFVPKLRSLVHCTREWGSMNPHGAFAEADLRHVASFIARHNRLPHLENLDLAT